MNAVVIACFLTSKHLPNDVLKMEKSSIGNIALLILLQNFLYQPWNVKDGIGHWDSRSLQSRNFALRGTGIAGNDRARVPHAFPWRGRTPADKGHNRLAHRLDIFGRILLVASSDLAAYHDHLRLWIFLEEFQMVGEGRADDGVAADTDAGRLPDPRLSEECHNLIGECARAGDEADRTWLEDLVRDNADLALSRRAQAWAVGADQRGSFFAHNQHGACHIDDGNVFGDADDQLNARVGGLHNGVSRASRGHEDATGIGIGGGLRLSYCIEDGYALDALPALAGGYAAYNASTSRQHIAGMVETFTPGNALYNHARRLI